MILHSVDRYDGTRWPRGGRCGFAFKQVFISEGEASVGEFVQVEIADAVASLTKYDMCEGCIRRKTSLYPPHEGGENSEDQ